MESLSGRFATSLHDRP